MEVKETAPKYEQDKHYTYADYLSWNDDRRWELVDGVPYAMSSPSRMHQRISSRLHGQLFISLKGKPCEVYPAPFDVRLNADASDDTVVQPDLLVVCDESKLLDGKSCIGAPDLVIEIISPSTAAYDKLLKFNRYKKAGVREYWIVDPDTKTVSAHILKNGEYVSYAYGDADKAPIHVLEGCVIDLAEVFEV